MTDEILRADARARKRTGIAVGVALLACIAVLATFQWWIGTTPTDMHTEALIARSRTLIALMLTGAALCLALLAGQAARSGRLACQHAQWPVPGARVLRDTAIVRGRAATRIGRRLQGVAIVLLVLALAAGISSWRLVAA